MAIPQNYSGNLFSDQSIDEEIEKAAEEASVAESPTEPEALPVAYQKKDLFGSLFNSEELLILGLLLLLSMDGFGDDIIPILLIILLFKK